MILRGLGWVALVALLGGQPPPVAPGARRDHAASPRPAPPGFVDLRGLYGIRLEVGYATPDNFTGAPLPGYGAPGAWLRDDAALALGSAVARLSRQGMGLVVYDAYRPRRAAAAMVRWAREAGRTDLLRDGYIAARSTHSRGHAVDVGLWDLATGEILDLGTPWDHFGSAAAVGAAAGPAGRRQAELRAAMQAAGFVGYRREWWHFTLPGGGVVSDVPYGPDEPGSVRG